MSIFVKNELKQAETVIKEPGSVSIQRNKELLTEGGERQRESTQTHTYT